MSDEMNATGELRVVAVARAGSTFQFAPPRPTHAYAVLTPSQDADWGWRLQSAEFFVDSEQAIQWGEQEHGLVVALPIVADYRESLPEWIAHDVAIRDQD